jgi:uncharacterized protein YjbJ (UPF0337 family)
MNRDILEGKWAQMSGKAKSKWAKLTDDDMQLISGKRDVLVGKLQERYGHAKDAAEKEVDGWLDGVDDGTQDDRR